jgi:hypothetical protein
VALGSVSPASSRHLCSVSQVLGQAILTAGLLSQFCFLGMLLTGLFGMGNSFRLLGNSVEKKKMFFVFIGNLSHLDACLERGGAFVCLLLSWEWGFVLAEAGVLLLEPHL